MIWVWIAFVAIGSLPKLWQWLQRKAAENWPTTPAKIENTEIGRAKWSVNRSSRGLVAQLHYSYSVAGEYYSGTFEKSFATEAEAEEFLRDLTGKSTFVRYKADQPARSTLLPQDLETLLTTRSASASSAEITLSMADTLPVWSLPFLGLFLGLAAVGFILSLWIHIGAVFGVRVAPQYFFWMLHMGVFVVFLPAVLVAQRLVGNTRRSDFWKVVLKDIPLGLRYVVYASFGYALLNFMLFASKSPAGGTGANPPAQVWRGFSGHWMAFYSASFAILYAGAVANRTRRPT